MNGQKLAIGPHNRIRYSQHGIARVDLKKLPLLSGVEKDRVVLDIAPLLEIKAPTCAWVNKRNMVLVISSGKQRSMGHKVIPLLAKACKPDLIVHRRFDGCKTRIELEYRS